MSKEQTILKKQSKPSFDLLLLMPAMLLFGIGLVSLYSCLFASDLSGLFWKQVVFGSIGFVTAVVIYFIPTNWIKLMAAPGYIFSLLLLLAVLTGLGAEINGTKGWLRLGGFSLQPAEIAKPAVLLFVAWRLSNKYSDINHLAEFLIIFSLFLVPSVAILLQPDFGSFSVLLVLFYGILYWSGFSGFILYTIACLPILAFISLIDTTLFYILASLFFLVSFLFRRRIIMPLISGALFFMIGIATPLIVSTLKDYQQARIHTFLNPESDPLGTGYNVLQSILAIGSGGIFGKGFMQGTQTQLRFIPMQWTDFIFSVPLEEFGFIAGLAIVLLFVWLLYRGIRISIAATTRFHSLLSAGCVIIIFYHAIINMGMAMGIMPVTGIPLPFLSYGGTSLLINFIMIGFLLHISKINTQEQVKFAA